MKDTIESEDCNESRLIETELTLRLVTQRAFKAGGYSRVQR